MQTATDDKTYAGNETGLTEAAADLVKARAATEQPEPQEGAEVAPEAATDADDRELTTREAARIRSQWRRQREEEAALFNGNDLPPDADAETVERFVSAKERELAELQASNAQAYQDAERILGARAALEQAKATLAEAKETVSPTQEEPPQAPLGSATSKLQYATAALQQEFAQNFPGISSVEDLVRLEVTDPPRADAARRYLQAAREIHGFLYQDAAGEQHQLLGSQHDAAFRQANIELNEPTAYEKAAKTAVEYLTQHLGYPMEAIEVGWNFGQGPLANIRDWRNQQEIYDASRLWAGKKAAATRQARRDVPVTQRPGVGRGPEAEKHDQVAALNKKFARSNSVRDAARLLAARRAAARR